MSLLNDLIEIFKFNPSKESEDLIFDPCEIPIENQTILVKFYYNFHKIALKNFSKRNKIEIKIFFVGKELVIFRNGREIKKEINKYLGRKNEGLVKKRRFKNSK